MSGWSNFIEWYEQEFVAKDPDRLNKPVIALRKADIDEESQAKAWGPNWRESVNERDCVQCGAVVIVRDVFKDNKVILCQPCGREFIRELGKGASA